MDRLLGTFLDYYNQQDFRVFQNAFALKLYGILETSYSNSDNEVKIVDDMCEAIKGEKFKNLKFYAEKIHGSRSYVKFYNQNKSTTTELADMVIISVATKQREIIYEKTAFIQNKKESSKNNWKIDQDQLYLLHNFPIFKGEKGIIRQNFDDNVVFQNHSETLGNYGLFKSPGEMILVNALSVFKLLRRDKILFSDLRKYLPTKNTNFSFPLVDYSSLDELLFGTTNNFPKYGFPFLNLPFLGNSIVSFNIYEFIRNWSLFNIGEVVSVADKVEDNDLCRFNRILLHNAGFSEFINLRTEIQDYNLEDNLAIMVAHLNLD